MNPGDAVHAPVQVLMPAHTQFARSDFGRDDEASLAPLFHSLRRQWIVGTVLGVVVSLPLAFVTWKVMKPQYSSTAYLRLAPQVQLVFQTADSRGDDFRTFKNTQRQLLMSPFVLNSALDRLDGKQYPQLDQIADANKWLEKNLKVTFPEDAEIMRVEFSDTEPLLVKPVLEAVIDAYQREIVDAEKDQRTRRLSNLEKIYSDTESKVRGKRGALKDNAELLGTSDSQSLSLAQQATMQQYGLMRSELTKLKFEIRRAEGEFHAFRELADRKNLEPAAEDGEQTKALDLDQLLVSDQQLAELTQEKNRLQRLISETQKRMSPEVAKKRVEGYEQDIQQVKGKMERRLEQLRLAGTLDMSTGVHDAVAQAKFKVEMLKQQQDEVQRDLKSLEAETKKYGTSSIEVEMMRSEIDSMDKIVQDLWNEIERSHIELNSPSRITKLDAPSPPALVDSKKRVASVFMAGAGGFALPLILLTLLDRRRRVIDTPAEVTSNLRIRLLGTLPEVPTSVMRQLNDESKKSSLWRWRLTESINSVAAMVQRNAALEDRRALLISSANAGEGKSTLAAYLATSLAESGYNTLLIDFDLRRPSLHTTFGVPLSPGVTDILFNDIPIADAVVATETANLHLLVAGQWKGSILSGSRSGAIKELLTTVRDDYEFVIIDACPVLAAADACLVGQHADGVLLSVRKNISQLPNVTAACESLRSHGIDILGTVVGGCANETYRQSDYVQLTTT
jgi:capsular exopolysaccharide synthesis family protein